MYMYSSVMNIGTQWMYFSSLNVMTQLKKKVHMTCEKAKVESESAVFNHEVESCSGWTAEAATYIPQDPAEMLQR